MIEIASARGRICLKMTATVMGQDLCVTLSGGDAEHIGAVAISQSRSSANKPGTTSSTTSVFALLGHKEDDLAKEIARSIAEHVNSVVCVACGIHLDNITAEEIRQTCDLAHEMTMELIRQVHTYRL